MLHFARNPTVEIPVDVPYYDGFAPVSGEEQNFSVKVVCLDNGLTMDSIDGQFKQNPVAPNMGMQPYSAYSNVYHRILKPTDWNRGHYRAWVHHATGQSWAYDFTLGLYVDRKLGYSAVYDGEVLSASFWVEEAGLSQTDYTSVTDLKLLNLHGDEVVTFANLTEPNNGIFTLVTPVNLLANRNYILECTVHCPGPIGKPDLSFPLRLGFARP